MNSFQSNIEELRTVLEASLSHSAQMENICETCANAIKNGHTVFTCGNGGSAADAMHFTEELTGRYKNTRKPLRGICLNSDAAALTCIANDFGYDNLFSRQLEALASTGDVLLLFSSSGNSRNQLEAIDCAKQMGVISIMLSGRGGGTCAKVADISFVVESQNGARVQEIHGLLLHTIIEAIEEVL